MKHTQKVLSLKTIFLGVGAVAVLVIIGALAGYFISIQTRDALQNAKGAIQNKAEVLGQSIMADMEVAMDTSRSLSLILGDQNANSNSLNRQDVILMLRKVLDNSPSFFGISTGWEANKFDGLDKDFENVSPSDSTGRFIPYWYRDDQGKPALTYLVDYETPGIGDYYLLPKTSLHETVIEPYLYPINGVDVALTSFMVPITNRDEFVGVIGVDFRLDKYQEIADTLDFMDGTAKMYLVSNSGIIVSATHQAELINTKLSESFGGEAEKILSASHNGEVYVVQDDNLVKVNVPFYVGNSDQPWSVLVTVPTSTVLADVRKETTILWILAAALTVFALVVIYVLANMITKPLRILSKAANVIADGELKWEIAPKDAKSVYSAYRESNALATALDVTVNNMIEKVVWYEGILDSIPLPISVTDMDLNWTFINKSTENVLGITRTEAAGTQCKNWNASICDTLECGIARLRNGVAQTLFDQAGGNFKVDTSYLLNTRGEKTGHVEVVSEITNLVAASQYEKGVVEQLSGYLEQMAEGQLGFDIENLPDATEHTREVRENFSKILENLEKAREMLRTMISTVMENSKHVAASSQELALASEQAGQATSQIATTIQQVTSGITQQSEATARITTMIEEEVKAIQNLVEGTQRQGLAVRKAGEVTNLISSTGGISDKVSESNRKVEEMGERSNKIGAIVETIDDIASQTNLLALNAAIEAARAGEQGKGFAVVADEVRKLAERSSIATKEIAALIGEIQSTVKEAVQVSTSAAQEIGIASGDLMESIEAVAKVVEENEIVTQKLSASSNEVMQAMENIAAVSEENGAAVEQVSASTEEMTAQVEEVNASAQSLSDMAALLQESTQKFTL